MPIGFLHLVGLPKQFQSRSNPIFDSTVLEFTSDDYPWVKHLKANTVFYVISSVHPGGLVQGLRVTLMHINGLAKGTDSDNVRHSGPDTKSSRETREPRLHDRVCASVFLSVGAFVHLFMRNAFGLQAEMSRCLSYFLFPKLFCKCKSNPVDFDRLVLLLAITSFFSPKPLFVQRPQ